MTNRGHLKFTCSGVRHIVKHHNGWEREGLPPKNDINEIHRGRKERQKGTPLQLLLERDFRFRLILGGEPSTVFCTTNFIGPHTSNYSRDFFRHQISAERPPVRSSKRSPASVQRPPALALSAVQHVRPWPRTRQPLLHHKLAESRHRRVVGRP